MFGPVLHSEIKGKVVFQIFPPAKFGPVRQIVIAGCSF